jgi:spore germination protein YaaH
MFRTRLRVLAVAATTAALLASGCAGSASPPTSDHATGAIPIGPVVWYRTLGSGTELLTQNARRVAVLHPTAFHVEALDRIYTDPAVTQIAQAARSANPRVLIVPAVADDTLSQNPRGAEQMKRLLLDQKNGVPGETMTKHVEALVNLAKPYDGLAVDYEFTIDQLTGDPTRYREGFTVFIQTLRHKLGPDKILAVAVKPRTDSPLTFAQSVYDYHALGRVADLVEVMAYDHAWQTSEPGDIAPAGWVADVTAYARRELSGTGTRPVLLIPNYGYDWPVNRAGQSTGPANAESATGLTRLPGFSPAVASWSYRGGTQDRVVWQVTASAMAHEVATIARPNGFDPGFWSASEADPQGWAKILTALGSG